MVSPVRGLLGVALRGQDDADGGVAGEGRRAGLVELAVRHGEEELGGVGGQQREHDLGLGVAEAHVVLNDLGAVGGQHEPGVEHAAVVDAAAAQLLDQRQDGGVHERRPSRRVHVGHRRVGAHAAGVGPGVAVADALEVLRRDERHGARAVAEDEQRALLAHEPLLDHDVAPGVAEGGARQLGRDVGAGLVEGLRHQHALAGGQAVGLDHPGPGQRLEVVQGGGRPRARRRWRSAPSGRRPRRGPPS